MPKPRFRYSLLTLLLLTTIVALVVSYVRTSLTLSDAGTELEHLRRVAGEMTISDPDLIHAVRMPTIDDNTWKWRVYVPDGTNAYMYRTVNDIPLTGFPKEYIRWEIVSGETIVTAKVRPDGKGRWQFIVDRQIHNNPTISGEISVRSTFGTPGGNDWPSTTSKFISSSGVESSTSVMDDDEPFVLIRYRTHPAVTLPNGNDGYEETGAPADGFMIWIEQK